MNYVVFFIIFFYPTFLWTSSSTYYQPTEVAHPIKLLHDDSEKCYPSRWFYRGGLTF